jgi:thioredoxin-related protein
MKPAPLIALLFASLVAGTGLAASGGDGAALKEGMVNPGYHEPPAWFKNSFLDIREDVAEAADAGKRIMLYFYQDGCPYCGKLLQDNFADRGIAEFTQEHFDVVAINMWGDRDVVGFDGESASEKGFAETLRVQFTPTLLLLDERGRVVLRINGYFPPHKFRVALDYVAGGHERTEKFTAYLAAQSPRAARGELHALGRALPHPLKLAANRAASQRHLLVLFEQRECIDCDELHDDVFSRREIAVSLSNLDVAQVDMFSDEPVETPSGATMEVREWARELRVNYAPTLVFLDPDGHEVFRTEAYLKSFHIHGAIDYAATGAYRWQPNFQRYLQERREAIEALGFAVDLME